MAIENCICTKVIEMELVEWIEVMQSFVYLAKKFKLYPESSGGPWNILCMYVYIYVFIYVFVNYS